MEDEAASQQALKEAFEGKGYNILLASNGEEGLELAKKQKPNLILLDIIMPKKDGFEVMQEINDDASISHIPVVLLTNLSHAQDIEKAIGLGARTYLVKSEYQLEDIVKKVQEHIN